MQTSWQYENNNDKRYFLCKVLRIKVLLCKENSECKVAEVRTNLVYLREVKKPRMAERREQGKDNVKKGSKHKFSHMVPFRADTVL